MAALPKVWVNERGATAHDGTPVAARIASLLASVDPAIPQAQLLRALIDAGLDDLPLPGRGATLARWQALERVARHDLALVKLYEGHTDALAILAEVEPGIVPSPGAVRAVWASESRTDPIVVSGTASQARIDGRKSWCSGASVVDLGLMSAVDQEGRRRLVELDMAGSGVRIDADRWQAVGMRESGSFDIVCTSAPVRLVGDADAYLERPGFWHGGAGIAACWFGGAAAIGTRLRDLQRGRDDVPALAHLGAIDAALASVAALLRECARRIDDAPRDDAMRIALRVRGTAADVALRVIEHAERAMGPGPLCNEPALARLVADLPIFVRQSRAEHDLVAQARALLGDDAGNAVSGMVAVNDLDLVPHAPERRRIEGDGTDERAWHASPLFGRMRSIDVGDWHRRFRRIWVLAPHPDDEVLGLGGTLAALSALHADVRIVSLTDGEASHGDSADWPRDRLAAARQSELRDALAALHIDAGLQRLGLPDGRIDAHREMLLTSLADLVDEGELVLATCRFDGHPDHEACGDVAQLVGEITGATVYEYPVWMWHWAAPDEMLIPWDHARRLPISPATVERKRLAIDAFVSQVTPDGAHAPVLPAHVIPRFLRPFEVVFA